MEHFKLQEPPLGAVIEQDFVEHHFVEVEPGHPVLFELGELAVAHTVEV